MKWQALVVASVVCGFAYAQVPAAPPGATKPVSKKADRVLKRAKSMREGITKGRQVKAHVKVMVRLQNGNRLSGVVKDGRLVERVDGLRFVDAQARDLGAGIRLWYSGGTRSYIFVPFKSLKNYEIVQRLSQKQLLEIETSMQMAENRAKERAAKAARRAKGSATGDVPAPGTLDVNSTAPKQSDLEKIPGYSDLPNAPKPAGAAPAGGDTKSGATAANKGDAATPAKVSDSAGDLKQAKQQLAWAQLLRSYPPKAGWNAAKKNEIARRRSVLGVVPSDFEMAFVKQFDKWLQACEHNGVDPNAGVVKKPETKRDRRRAERSRIRGR